jgi:GH15 family glucan-1,4-alpha-glucosidase
MDLIKKSIEVMKKSQLSNGGLMATPPSGAYPYVYIRDGVIMTKAFNAVKEFKRSEKFYYFLKENAKISQYKELFHRYDPSGLPSATQTHENDNGGLLLHGVYDTYLAGKKEVFIENMWPLIESTSKLIFSLSRNGLVKTNRSIHESIELEKGYELWTNCASWRGIKDAAEIADILGHEKQKKLWNKKAAVLEKNINNKLFNQKKGFYIKKYKLPETPDISQLAPFYFGLIDSKKILKNTMSYVKKHLWNKEIGGFRRFRKFETVENWHWYTGGSGSWAAFTAWGARFYKELGDKENQKMCVNWLKKVASRTNGLLPEHIATKSEYRDWKAHEIEFNQRLIQGMRTAEKFAKNFKDKNDLIYWATPLGWAHAEYILMNKRGK